MDPVEEFKKGTPLKVSTGPGGIRVVAGVIALKKGYLFADMGWFSNGSAVQCFHQVDSGFSVLDKDDPLYVSDYEPWKVSPDYKEDVIRCLTDYAKKSELLPNVPTVDEIRAKACAAAFGEPLISNIYRGLIAEIIVGAALGTEWRLCSGDWRGWDFEHTAGCRLEVKQSAARQTWTGSGPATNPIFDIRARTGYFEGADWIADPRRFAEIYIFAYHSVIDESAEHRDANQWRFYVVPTKLLPSGKTISLKGVAKLANVVPWDLLATTVERTRLDLAASQL